MITFPANTIMDLHETSPLLAFAGVGAFILTTTGTMLLKCLINRRQQRNEAKFETKMGEIVTNAVLSKGSAESVNSGKVLEV